MVKMHGIDLEGGAKVLDLRAECLAGLPAAGSAGRIVFETGAAQLYVDDGTTWLLLSAQLQFTDTIDAAFLTTNGDSTGAAGNEDGGLKVKHFVGATQTDAVLRWDSTGECWLAGFGAALAKIARKYVHTEDPAALSWSVNHNLNTLNPNVQIIDTDTAEVIIPDTIVIVDADNLTVTFTSAIKGRAVVIG